MEAQRKQAELDKQNELLLQKQLQAQQQQLLLQQQQNATAWQTNNTSPNSAFGLRGFNSLKSSMNNGNVLLGSNQGFEQSDVDFNFNSLSVRFNQVIDQYI